MPSKLEKIYRDLSDRVGKLDFGPPTAHVYNPLEYARAPFEKYLRTYGKGKKQVVLMGMNPGPFGMAQTGVPFGDVSMVAGWMNIKGSVGRPEPEHPKRPIEGFDCKRSEVSGTRLWSWARDRFGTPESFFSRFFVLNYCPLVFMEAGGKNRTPDKLPKDEQKALFAACDTAVKDAVALLDPEFALGVGAFAEKQLGAALDGSSVKIGRILHPSPASPAANRGWAEQVDKQLEALGI